MLTLVLTYNINLKDKNINYINKITKIYDKFYRNTIHLL